MGTLRAGWDIVRAAVRDWSDDRAPRLGAALAYYTVFSLPPLLVIVLGIAGLVLGEEAARGRLVDEIRALVGQDAAGPVEQMVANARRPERGAVATIVGVVTLLVGASGVFGELQAALNTVWDVETKPGLGWWATIRARFLSMTMVLGTGFLLLVSLVVSTVLARLGRFVGGLLPLGEAVGHAVDLAVSLAGTALVFAALFKWLPDVQVAWRDVWGGAVVTALLFVVGKALIGLYLGHADLASGFGAAGSLILLLAWVYYSAQILLFGAEVTQVWARRRGPRVRPTPEARPTGGRARAPETPEPSPLPH